MRIDAIVKDNNTFTTMIFKLCCISRVPVIFHLLCLEFWRLKKSCNSTSYAQMQNLLLLRLFQNVLITNGIWILLQFAAKSGENRVWIRTVNCSYSSGQIKVRIGTVNCPYSSGVRWIGTHFCPYSDPLIFIPRRFALEVSSKMKCAKWAFSNSIYKTNEILTLFLQRRCKSMFENPILISILLCEFQWNWWNRRGCYLKSGLSGIVKNHVQVEYASEGARTAFSKPL